MQIFIEEALVIDPSSSYHQKKVSLLLEEGKPLLIDPTDIPADAKRLSQKGLHISPSWFDMRVFSGEHGKRP